MAPTIHAETLRLELRGELAVGVFVPAAAPEVVQSSIGCFATGRFTLLGESVRTIGRGAASPPWGRAPPFGEFGTRAGIGADRVW